MDNCLICKRIEMIKNNENQYFVKELETGYVVLGDHQRFKGYTLFLCKEHQTELFHLERDKKLKFLEEMSIVAEAVSNAFDAEKINYVDLKQNFFMKLCGVSSVQISCAGYGKNKNEVPVLMPLIENKNDLKKIRQLLP